MAGPKEIEADEDVDDENAADEKPKRSNLIVVGAASVAAFGVAAGAGYVLAPSASPQSEYAEEDHAAAETGDSASSGHGSSDKKDKGHGGKKSKNGKKSGKLSSQAFDGGELKVYGETAYFVLDPLVITIRPIASKKHLRISLVFETSLEEASALLDRVFHIRDILNTYLRSVDRTAFENPAAMARLRTQIRRRIHAIAPDVTIDNVLITEFILT